MEDTNKDGVVAIQMEDLTKPQMTKSQKKTYRLAWKSPFQHTSQPYEFPNQPYQSPNQPYQFPNQPYVPPNQPPYQYQSQGHYSTPVYRERLDGQPVYYVGGPPQNVSRGGQPYQVNYPGEANDNYYYVQTGMFTDAFSTVKIRNRFVQRVYTILSLLLFFSFGFILLTIYEPNMRSFFKKNWFLIMILSLIIYLGTAIALFCVTSLRRTFPINFMLLSILSLALTFSLTVLTVGVDTKIVLYAIGTTAAVTFLVSIFAIQTKWDVTGCGMCLCIGMLVLFVFGLIILILNLCGIDFKLLHVLYSSMATLLFCFWLMYDTQQIIGGRRYELSPEEYIYGALSLYIDIIYIFMHILMLYHLCLGGGGD